ncbi:MAG TPA: prepilin-type N-terminal cleavage/methylation domain-containing protein [Gemmatimonadales bacterium]|nr:prepilin-type N-terminal cleavage/methylation domain-containing protein [Gemmatimonadales bacterium]
MMGDTRGFTIVEVLVAIVVVTVGMMALLGTAALVTRMIARGQRSAVAAQFAQQRIEQLRNSACTSQAAGTDTLSRGSTWVAINTWNWTALTQSTWKVTLAVRYKTAQGRTRTEQMETGISCLR